MKKVTTRIIIMAIAIILISSILAIPVKAESNKKHISEVFDYCGYMSESEIKKLQSHGQMYADAYGLDIVFVLTLNAKGKTSMQYADEFYDGFNDNNHEYSDDGLLFLIDLDNDENYIDTVGSAIDQLTDREIDWVLDEAAKVPLDQYYECFEVMLETTIKYYIDTTDNYSSTKTFNLGAMLWSVAIFLILSMIINIPTYFIKKSNKIKANAVANRKVFYRQYKVGDGLTLVSKNETLVNTDRTVNLGVYAPRTTSSYGGSRSGGSFHGGSSHSSRTSSGGSRSHGGGGRHR